jgi:plastocyanin
MKVRSSMLFLTLLVASACAQPGSSPTSPGSAGGSLAASTGSSATIRFGNDTVGSGFPTPLGHDQSGHARDNLIPRTVVIDKGGTVTFEMGGPVHQVGIYADGTKPEDVVRAGAVHKAPPCPQAPPAVYITGAGDPNFIAVAGQPRCSGGAATQSYTFNTPGTYLVICMFIPHLDLGMYGWVEVRDR